MLSASATSTPIWLVNSSHLATIWLAVVSTIGAALIAWWQIHVAASRKSVQSAINLCQEFSRVVEPMLEDAHREMDTQGLPKVGLPPNPQFTRKELNDLCSPSDLAKVEALTKTRDFERLLCRLLNEFEVHALAYKTKAADEAVGYAGYGGVLDQFIRRAYPYIAFNRLHTTDAANRPWEEALRLWREWAKKSPA